MKFNSKNVPHFSRKMGIIMVFFLIVFACSKTNTNPASATAKYCLTVDWSNQIGLSGYFTGAQGTGGVFGLVAVSTTENGTETFMSFHRTNNANQILNDQAGRTFTYSGDKLVKIVISGATGSITYTFDTNGHLTNTDTESTDGTSSESGKFTYTYDNNDDPVKIVGHAISSSNTGTSTADYDITADYLTDKSGFLPFIPEIAPFTIYFAYSNFLSRHLINKWVIKIDGITEDGTVLPTINFTQQYTYTYDSNGRVATMVHTGNSKNIYTFTYSGCN